MKYFSTIALILSCVTFSFQDGENESSELEDIEEKMEAIVGQCMNDNNIHDFPEDSSELDTFIGNADFQCFVKCKLTKQGLLNGDGEVNESAMKKLLDPFDKCLDIKGDTCKNAFEVFQCQYEALQKLQAQLLL